MLIDTHCHVHDTEFYPENREEVYGASVEAGVEMICVGTDVRSSREAVKFCIDHDRCYPVVGIHPHEAKDNDAAQIRTIVEQNRTKVVGIGEIGLDYYYDHSPREVQKQRLREQLELAREFDLPVSFHVRDAYEDFWLILDEFPEVRGVLHSFTDSPENLKAGIKRGLFIGINGISTFTKDQNQRKMYEELPLEHILLETDAPFLTPAPFRGKMNVPAYVERVAAHQAETKSVSVSEVARITTANARELFGV